MVAKDIKTDVIVAVETAVHDGLRRVVERILEKHGLRVVHMSVVWCDVSTQAAPGFKIVQLEITTASAGRAS